ncbi:MAG: CHASE2 domain-containing protein [Verrucomicrobiaceae bacterium]|nr:MAG: CHASE2 domain-containing protein [Verrucomicrobiaceae bacterium]
MNVRSQFLLLLGAGILATLLHREQQRGTFEIFDRRHREFLKANPGATEWRSLAEKPQVVLARLDDPDLPTAQRTFDAWPPLPDEWQVLFQNIRDYAPAAVAVALPLRVETPSAGFAAAAAAVPGLTLGLLAESTRASGAPPLVLPPGVAVLRAQGPVSGIPVFDRLTVSGMTVPQAVSEVDLGQKVTMEGDWCRVPLLARTGAQVVPTLALQALLTWNGTPLESILVQTGTAIRGPKGMVIPIDEEGCFRFYVPLAPPAQSVSADDFLFPKTQAETLYIPGTPERAALEKVRGSLLWVGTDDRASRLLKLPDGNTASPADLITRALTAIQTGRFMRPLEPAWQIVTLTAAVLLGCWMARWRRWNLTKGLLIASLCFGMASLLAFQSSHTWIPLAPAPIQLAASLFVGLLIPRPAPPAKTKNATLSPQSTP